MYLFYKIETSNSKHTHLCKLERSLYLIKNSKISQNIPKLKFDTLEQLFARMEVPHSRLFTLCQHYAKTIYLE